jgi:hypothetical protein
MGVLYSARRAAAAADLNGRGAWNVGSEASGEWRAASEYWTVSPEGRELAVTEKRRNEANWFGR